MKPEKLEKGLMKKLDLVTMTVPLIGIVVLCALFMILPEQSTNVLGKIRGFLGDDLGIYYVLIAAGALICSMYMAFSRYGKIRLGNVEKPEYSDYQWDPEMGVNVSVVSLGTDCMEFLHCTCSRVWIYASCQRQGKTKIFGSLPPAARQSC